MPAADDLLVASQAQTDRMGCRLAGTASDDDLAGAGQREAWLIWMAELLKGAHGLALVSISESGSATMSDQYPAGLAFPATALALARRAADRRSRQRLVLPDTGKVLLGLPLPTDSEDEHVSTVLLLLSGALSQQQQSTLLGLATWAVKSARWWRDSNVPAGPFFSRDGNALSQPLNGSQLVNLLGAQYPGCLCALHWMKVDRHGQRSSRVLAVSGQASIDRTGAAVRRLAEHVDTLYARGPAILQHRVQAIPPGAQREHVTDDTREGALPSAASLMIPISAGDELLVLSLHGNEGSQLPGDEREQLLASLIPAVQSVWLQRQCEQSLPKLLWRRCRTWVKRRIQGGVRLGLQLGACAGVLLILFWPVEKRLSAEILVEAAERHALIAPLDGYVKSVQARAGDRVAKGDLLASLDDEDLLRQADKWAAEAQKNQQDHLSALAAHDRVELSALRENRGMIQTELEQVRAQLARHQLRAPVSGIVLNDAVEDALGSAVKAGKILFEVGSAEQYRLALQVPERRISEVEPGQLLSLRMAADPKQRSQARVDTLIPVATASQGQNTFKVYASPLSRDEGLRPGMKGIGKIVVGRESRLMQWGNSLWSRCVWLAWKLGLVA